MRELGIFFIATHVIAGVVGWGVIEGARYLLEHIHFAWA